MITLVALLLFSGLYLGLLILVVFLAIRAKTVGGRIASIVTGVALLFIVPLFLIAATFTLGASRTETATTMTMPSQPAGTSIRESTGPIVSTKSMTKTVPAAPAPPPSDLAPAAPLPVDDQQAAATWTATDRQPLKANVYPSYSAAIASHLSSLREILIEKDILDRDDQNQIIQPDSILVTGDGSEIKSLLAESTDLISEQFPDVEVRSKSRGWPDSSKNQLSVRLSQSNVVRQTAPWEPGDGQNTEHSFLTFEIQLDNRQTSFQCFVTEKPWVESFDRFVSMYPKRRFIVGYSNGLHSSEGQARAAAMNDVVRQGAITVKGGRFAIVSERHVVDRFAQRLTQDYGEVWREAVLVELPDANEVNVARATVTEEFRRSTFGKMSKLIGITVLVVVTILLCLLLNWVTQGYYRGRVLLGLTGVVIGGFLLATLFVA